MDRIKMGEYLSELRKEKELSQVDLAEIIGVTFQAVSKWERGEAIPDISILEKLSSFYNVTIEEIIKGEADINKGTNLKVEKSSEEILDFSFFNQKRVFGFWFCFAYLILFLLFGLCPFLYGWNYYNIVFSPEYNLGNFIYLIQFLTTIGIFLLTALFYACTTRNAFHKLYITRFIFIILNLATMIMNIVNICLLNASVGNYLMLLIGLTSDILILCLKTNRKAYIMQDFKF